MTLIFGKDINNDVWPVLVDSAGRPLVAQSDPSKLLIGNYAYFEGGWVRQPPSWSYSAKYAERIVNYDAVAGTNVLVGSVVPASEVWVIQQIAAWDAQNAPTEVRLAVVDANVAYYLARVAPGVANVPLIWTGAIALATGAKIYAMYTGCEAGDDLYLTGLGYKMTLGAI